MRSEHIEQLLDSLGCVRIYRAARGVRSTCPLASWNHSGGEDKHPSFFVFIDNDGASNARCQGAGCGFKGDLIVLLYKLQKLSKRDLSAQMMFVAENNSVSHKKRMQKLESVGSWYNATPPAARDPKKSAAWEGGKDYSDPVVAATLHPPLPDSHKDHEQKMVSLLNDEAMQYLTGIDRRFTEESIAKYSLGWHPWSRRIAVPQYDFLGRLVNIGGRYLRYWPDVYPSLVPASDREDRVPKWMHSLGFHRDQYLFGEDRIDRSEDGRGVVFLVEGPFDVIYLVQCGIKNVVAINGSHINGPQIEKLLKWFDSVVIVMDGDAAGGKATTRLEKVFAKRIHVATYAIPDGRDPNQMTEYEVEDLKYRFCR